MCKHVRMQKKTGATQTAALASTNDGGRARRVQEAGTVSVAYAVHARRGRSDGERTHTHFEHV
eukprot:3726943-Pleurochrysis_carterae.AAC.1